MIPGNCAKIYLKFIEKFPYYYTIMECYHKTLTHNDFNSRNICLSGSNGNSRKLVVYDWELPAYQNPQHDVIEFLSYVMDLKDPVENFDFYSDFYRMELEKATGIELDKNDFNRVLYLNSMELSLIRFNLYLLAHNIVKFKFIGRVYGNLVRFIEYKNRSIPST